MSQVFASFGGSVGATESAGSGPRLDGRRFRRLGRRCRQAWSRRGCRRRCRRRRGRGRRGRSIGLGRRGLRRVRLLLRRRRFARAGSPSSASASTGCSHRRRSRAPGPAAPRSRLAPKFGMRNLRDTLSLSATPCLTSRPFDLQQVLGAGRDAGQLHRHELLERRVWIRVDEDGLGAGLSNLCSRRLCPCAHETRALRTSRFRLVGGYSSMSDSPS